MTSVYRFLFDNDSLPVNVECECCTCWIHVSELLEVIIFYKYANAPFHKKLTVKSQFNVDRCLHCQQWCKLHLVGYWIFWNAKDD